MAAYRRVYDSRHLQADCQEPGSAPKQSSMGYLYLCNPHAAQRESITRVLDRAEHILYFRKSQWPSG